MGAWQCGTDVLVVAVCGGCGSYVAPEILRREAYGKVSPLALSRFLLCCLS
jgi:hypothetical protein